MPMSSCVELHPAVLSLCRLFCRAFLPSGRSTLPPAWCHLQTYWGCTQCPHPSPIKRSNRTGPSTDSMTTGCNSIHHHPLDPAFLPVLYPAKSILVQAMDRYRFCRRILWETARQRQRLCWSLGRPHQQTTFPHLPGWSLDHRGRSGPTFHGPMLPGPDP